MNILANMVLPSTTLSQLFMRPFLRNESDKGVCLAMD